MLYRYFYSNIIHVQLILCVRGLCASTIYIDLFVRWYMCIYIWPIFLFIYHNYIITYRTQIYIRTSNWFLFVNVHSEILCYSHFILFVASFFFLVIAKHTHAHRTSKPKNLQRQAKKIHTLCHSTYTYEYIVIIRFRFELVLFVFLRLSLSLLLFYFLFFTVLRGVHFNWHIRQIYSI